MIKYIDTNKIEIPEGFFNDLNVPKFFQWLNDLPTVDLVDVVRCKDCKYFVSEICRHDFAMNLSRGDDFCSYGERRKEDADI